MRTAILVVVGLVIGVVGAGAMLMGQATLLGRTDSSVASMARTGQHGGHNSGQPGGLPEGSDVGTRTSMNDTRSNGVGGGSAGDRSEPAIRYSKSGHDISPLPRERVIELARRLTPEQARILLNKGTEQAFCGTLLDNKMEGTYVCRLCGLPLFSSDSKFNSGTGWPSFHSPFDPEHVTEERDVSHGMVRVEILCARCDGHLGHVFEDGPRPTGLRYCLNSESLEFFEKGTELPETSKPVATQTAYFAGGCFWGIEDRLQQIPGVIDAVSGYQGGSVDQPTYRQVCNGDTGHAESVRVRFDPARVTYRELLAWFFKLHDPTQLNRQGPDYGTQYRSAIFADSPEQAVEAREVIAEIAGSERFRGRRIVTQVVEPGQEFFEAEDYHQDYHLKHGGSCPLPEN